MLVAKTRTWKTAKQPFSLTEGLQARHSLNSTHARSQEPRGRCRDRRAQAKSQWARRKRADSAGPRDAAPGATASAMTPQYCLQQEAHVPGRREALPHAVDTEDFLRGTKTALWEKQKAANAHIPRPQSLWLGATEPARHPGEATPGPGASPVSAEQTLRTNCAWKTEDAAIRRGRKGSA